MQFSWSKDIYCGKVIDKQIECDGRRHLLIAVYEARGSDNASGEIPGYDFAPLCVHAVTVSFAPCVIWAIEQ